MAELFQVNSLFKDASLVSYYRMEGNSNDSADSNNGTDTLITYSRANGFYAQGAGINSATSGIDLGNPANLGFERTQAFSMVCWGYITSTGINRFFYSKQLASGNFTGIGWIINSSNQIELDLINTVTTNQLQVTSVPTFTKTNVWTHFGITYDGSSSTTGVKAYINGASIALTSATNNLSASILTVTHAIIGNRNAALPWTGNLDDFAIFTRVLTAQEMFTLASDIYPVSRLRPAIFKPG